MGVKTLNISDIQGKKVILRCDLNVPISDGLITDDGRIVASLSTIRKLLDAKCSIVLIAHLGRPKGERKPELSLLPVAKRLEELIGVQVEFSESILEASHKVAQLSPGKILMLENIRFESSETSKDESERSKFATVLAKY
jgi:phosphoglycerate kinase